VEWRGQGVCSVAFGLLPSDCFQAVVFRLEFRIEVRIEFRIEVK
jgi:hypothetical protein